MTLVELLDDLTAFCKDATKNMKFPLEVQQGDTKLIHRAPDVYKGRLPHSKEFKKYVPYIIVQVTNSTHTQKEGDKPRFMVPVRLVFCVYCEDEQEGSVMLLNLMDRVRYKLLKRVQVGKYSLLNVHEPLESNVYQEDTAPYFAGEMVGTFVLPGIEREVDFNGLKKVQRQIT